MKLDTAQDKIKAAAATIVAVGVLISATVAAFEYLHAPFFEFMAQYELDWSDELEARRARNYCRDNPGRC